LKDHWQLAPFSDLSPQEVHDIFRARAAVFVVEQACAFQDVDGADPPSWHLFRRDGASGEIAAYCRLVPPGIKFAEVSIGRVLTTEAARGTGMGRELMVEALRRAESIWPGKAIRIGAQQRLERFYQSLGFVTASAPYDEDGIDHVEKLLSPSTKADTNPRHRTGTTT
jgi:ElaA protein